VLRHQLAVLPRQAARPQPSWAARAFLSALVRILTATRRQLEQVALDSLVTPGVVLSGHPDVPMGALLP
jgi:hypothetical protein